LSCKVKKEGGKGPTYLFPFYTMDYASGDLKNYLENNDIPFGNRIDLCLQIANGLKELKDIGYYHRDLKPDNILMFDDTWKIGDLGLIAFRDKDNIYDKKNDFIGPKGWLSPEAMNKYLQSDNNKYKFDCNIDHQSDVFQLGKVFWYILQGNAPIGNIRRSDFFDGHDDIYSVLKYMLNHSKKKRPISIDYVINELSRIMQKYKFVC
jgi:non-specific serine/threonine protein kinase